VNNFDLFLASLCFHSLYFYYYCCCCCKFWNKLLSREQSVHYGKWVKYGNCMFMNFWCPPLLKSVCVGGWNEYDITERQLWLPRLCVILTALRFPDWTLKFCAVTVFWNLTHKNKCHVKYSHRASCSLVKNSQRKVNYKSYSTIRLISYSLQKCYPN
jgi:hypothetical protein